MLSCLSDRFWVLTRMSPSVDASFSSDGRNICLLVEPEELNNGKATHSVRELSLIVGWEISLSGRQAGRLSPKCVACTGA